MFALNISPGAKIDIVKLKSLDEGAAALLLVILQEIKGDQEVLDSLTIHDLIDVLPIAELDYEVKHWWEHYRKGKNLWRLRILEDSLTSYRIVYGYSPTEHAYYVLGIVDRDFNYDSNHPISKRILAEYEDLCC